MSVVPSPEKIQQVIEIGRALASIADPEAMRRHILESTVQLLKAGTGSLFVLDETSQDLHFDVALGPAGALLKHAIKLKKGEGLAGSVVESGKTEAVNDVANDPRHAARVNSMTGFSVQSALSVPLRFGDRIVGVLQLLNKQSEVAAGRFSEEDIWLAETIACFVSVAMEQSKERLRLEADRRAVLEIVSALGAHADPSVSSAHGERVAGIVRGMGARLGFRAPELELLRTAALLHDIGKGLLVVPPPSRDKPLADEARPAMRRHPELGAELLSRVPGSSTLIVPAVHHHHERFDGTGYPDGLSGEVIPIGARIIAVADAFEVMTSDQSYRAQMKPLDALAELASLGGTAFDPKVVEALSAAFKGGDLRHLKGLSPR